MDDDIGDVSVNEHLTGREIGQLRRRNAAVRASDPEVLRGLLLSKTIKELGIGICDFRSPRFVPLEKIIQGLHANSLTQRLMAQLTLSVRGDEGVILGRLSSGRESSKLLYPPG